MILATPSLTHIFDPSNGFIARTLKKLYTRFENSINVDILGAVVDQISFPATAEHIQPVSYKHPYVSGLEGLSILITNHPAAGLNLWGASEDRSTPSLSNPAFGEEGFPRRNPVSEGSTIPNGGNPSIIAFTMRSYDDFSKRVAGQYVAPLVRHTVQLPLTNTIFRNGRPATLMGQRWKVQKTPAGGIEANMTQERHLSHATVNIQLDDPHTPLEPNFQKWHALTPPRAVAKSAGNIIRSFKSAMGVAGEIPASEELEAAVTGRIIIPGATPPDYYEIWAQVTPKERWSGLPNNRGPHDSLDTGDRFLRVLSGGGGWGLKRGLIALDPDATFDSSDEGSGDQEPSSEATPFPQLIRQGDVVRFVATWLNKSAKLRLRRAQPLRASTAEESIQHWAHIRTQTSFRFGATPAIEDEEAPEQDTFRSMDGSQKPDSVSDYRNHAHEEYQAMAAFGHFGALSEQGLSVSVDTQTGADDRMVGNERLGNVVRTKLPPFVDLSYSERSVSRRLAEPYLSRKPKRRAGEKRTRAD